MENEKLRWVALVGMHSRKEITSSGTEACMLPIGTQEQNIMGVDETEASRCGMFSPGRVPSSP